MRATLAATVATAALLAVSGCGGSEDDRPLGASSPTALPTVHVDPSRAAADTGAPASVGEFCAPYVEMRRTLGRIDYTGDDDAVAAQMAPVMRAWAEQVLSLDRPPGIDDDVWNGLQLLAKRILRLPEEPTRRQLDAVEGDLTRSDQRLITRASDWFAANCVLSGRTAARRSR